MVAALATGVGATPVLLFSKISQKLTDLIMGFSAGIMLAAAVFSLLLPSLERFGLNRSQGPASLYCGAGILLGAWAVQLLHNHLPHIHFTKDADVAIQNWLSKTWLLIFAITLHNLPEGFAVGVGAGSESYDLALSITTGISLQNMPEGLIVAIALFSQGYSKSKSMLIAFLTGMVEPICSALGYIFVTEVKAALPWALAFSAGAMLFVISHEIIPESHSRGNERQATMGVLLGFVLMLLLDQWF